MLRFYGQSPSPSPSPSATDLFSSIIVLFLQKCHYEWSLIVGNLLTLAASFTPHNACKCHPGCVYFILLLSMDVLLVSVCSPFFDRYLRTHYVSWHHNKQFKSFFCGFTWLVANVSFFHISILTSSVIKRN